jgi:hypothetical protein
MERANAYRAETLWADPETRSESERADALVKRQSIGVPQQQLWRDAGYSEADVALFDQMVATSMAQGDAASAREIAEVVQKVYPGVPAVLTRDEARRIVAASGASLDADGDLELPADPAE